MRETREGRGERKEGKRDEQMVGRGEEEGEEMQIRRKKERKEKKG